MGYTPTQILTLAEAGFTAQQISALNSIQTPVQNEVRQMQTSVQTGTQQIQTPVQPSMPPKMETQEDMLSKILGAIQSNAINQTSQPERQTTDDILAEIINPPVKE